MAERAEELAGVFEQANQALINTLEGLSDEQWKATCEDEGWSVAVTAHHVSSGYPVVSGLIQALASGAEIQVTNEQIDQGNAAHAKEFANVTKHETMKELQEGGAAAASAVRALSDEQLDSTSRMIIGGPEMSLDQLVRAILIGSAVEHLESIRKVI